MAIDDTVYRLAQQIWDYHRLNLPLEKADCIVGLGSYDLRVAERCADLYAGGLAPIVIFSGNLGNWTSAIWDRSEAQIFAERAIAKGVPPDRIKLETKSTNIGENVRFTREMLSSSGIEARSAIIVTKPSTERRAFATFKKVWPEMRTYYTSPQIDFAEQLQGGIQDNLIHEMVGDIQRIRRYPDLGFQIPQVIPDEIWSAYECLVSMGYDKHLMKQQ